MFKTSYFQTYKGLRAWEVDIKRKLLCGNYTNRSRLQRQLLSIEKVIKDLTHRKGGVIL